MSDRFVHLAEQKSSDFVHLHTHSEYSMLDGAAGMDALCKEVSALGQPGVAVTDHGNLFGAYALVQAARKHGIKPIVGMEAYVAPGSRHDKAKVKWGTPEQSREDISGGGAYTHLTLLARSDIGVRNLFKLTSRSYSEGFYVKPRIDLELLGELSEGLLIGSGCLSGELQTRLSLAQHDEAEVYVGRMKERFGDAFFIEVMDHGFDREEKLLPGLLELGARHSIRTVATNDSHYIRSEDHHLHDAMLCVGTNRKLSDEKRMRFDGSGYHLRSRGEMEGLALPPVALDNALWVFEQIEDYGSVFEKTVRMPNSGIDRPEDALRGLVGWWLDENDKPKHYRDRASYELDVICAQGFSDYFLVLEDVISWAKSQGIQVGVGRGSAGGSLVAYALGITGLDPIVHGLLFERFLNADRISLPDVDVDFESARRDEVINYCVQKYGREYVARVGTIGTFGAKKALRGAARVLGRSFMDGTRLTWCLPRPQFGRMPSLSEADMRKVDDLEAFDLAVGLEGLASETGVHAAAFIVSPIPVTDVLPTFIPERKGDPLQATQFDGETVDKLGLVKYDFLATKVLDVLKSIPFPLPETLDDPKTFELFRSGHTLGVFQMDSVGMRALLKRMGPRTFGDVAAAIALYRPGPMGVNAHLQYADALNGRGDVRYPHPELGDALQDVLGPTYGVIVFQEQILLALQRVAGYSLSQADLVRKAMGKKNREILAAEKPRFMKGCATNGFSREAATALWTTMEPFADYAFGKAHSYGYAYHSYWTAYYKANYPKEWMAALLSFEDDPDKIVEYSAEIRRMGIRILPPSVNGGISWTATEQGVSYGLKSIKGVGEKAAAAIRSGAPYSGWSDYLRRAHKTALNTGVVKALIEAGAMDTLHGVGRRENLLPVYEGHIEQALTERAELARGERTLSPRLYALESLPPVWEDRARQECDRLGVVLSAPAALVRLSRPLSEGEWHFLRSCCIAVAGTSDLAIHFRSWRLDTDYQVDIGSLRQAVAALAAVVVESES